MHTHIDSGTPILEINEGVMLGEARERKDYLIEPKKDGRGVQP